MSQLITVRSITHRTVKSIACRNIPSVNLTRYGLEYNAVFIIVKPNRDRNGNFLRMITSGCHTLCKVQDEIDGTKVILRAPGMSDLILPLDHNEGGLVDVIMWNDNPVPGVEVKAGSLWFSEYLGMHGLKLVWLSPAHPRILNAKLLNRKYRTSWVDTRPFHFITSATIEYLSKHGGTPLSDARMRGIVLDTDGLPFSEDRWQTISINDIFFDVVKRKARCGITCIDPDTNEKGVQPLKAAVEQGRQIDKDVLFGVDCIYSHVSQGNCDSVLGTISVGDVVTVAEYKALGQE